AMRRRLGTRELLEKDRLVAVRGARAAVLLRPGQARVPRLAELLAPLTVGVLEPARPALPRVGGKLAGDEVAYLPAKGRLLRRVAEIHEAILTPGGSTHVAVKCPNMIDSCGGQ